MGGGRGKWEKVIWSGVGDRNESVYTERKKERKTMESKKKEIKNRGERKKERKKREENLLRYKYIEKKRKKEKRNNVDDTQNVFRL